MFIEKSRLSMSTVYNAILQKRQIFMGIAILMVVIYHGFGKYQISIPILSALFYRGYTGVDIFLFFSSLGLCFSYKKHSLKRFYINRFIRIAPLFILLAIFRGVFYQLDGNEFSLWDYVCNLTTLSYYGIGGCFVDWYLSSLVLFYLLFPLLFKYINTSGGVILSILISGCILLLIPMHWSYDCFIARVPIFFLGIVFFKRRDDLHYLPKMSILFVSLVPIFYLITRIDNSLIYSKFLSLSLFIPLVIIMLSLLIQNRLMYNANQMLAWIGKYTLEIYVANCMSNNIMHILPFHLQLFVCDLFITAILSIILFYINNFCLSFCQKYLLKYDFK